MKRLLTSTLAVASLVAAVSLSSAANGATTKKAATKRRIAPTTTTATAIASVTTEEAKPKPTLRIGSIPDQDPAKIQRGFGLVAKFLESKLGQKVEFVPVADYTAAVTAFRVGDLDLVWFGGLSGVQAQKQVKDAIYVAQRDIDPKFRSVFIAGTDQRLPAINRVADLIFLKGLSMTFGSENSTSGRTMPQFFLDQAGLELSDFKGAVGYSGSHDKTIRLVESGAYEAGALNKAVWDSNVAAKTVNLDKVKVVFTTPTFFDYHWLARPDTDTKFGSGTAAKLRAAFLGVNKTSAEGKDVLDFFGAESFIETKNENYKDIERIAKRLGLIS